jgi:hypothetical protein
MKILRILALVIAAAFILLLVVGFDNVLAAFRSRVALALVIAPIFILFLWCLYKAFRPQNRLQDRPPRDKRSI